MGNRELNLKDCFTVDLLARGKAKPSLKRTIELLFFDVAYRVVVYYRLSMYFKRRRFPKRLFIFIARLIRARLCNIPGVEFPFQDSIGYGFRIAHPHDVVLGSGCKIGSNVTIYNGVTLGAQTVKEHDSIKDKSTRYPTIEDGVTIFTGSKLIGQINIGKNSIIGANSVVNRSFPENSVIAGIPAKIIGKNDNANP